MVVDDMMRDDDTRHLRPPTKLVQLTAPDFTMSGPAKSLWINDSGIVTVNLVAEKDDLPIKVNVYGPSCLPVRVKRIISEGTTAKQIIAMCD